MSNIEKLFNFKIKLLMFKIFQNLCKILYWRDFINIMVYAPIYKIIKLEYFENIIQNL